LFEINSFRSYALAHKQAILQAKYELDVTSNSFKTIFPVLCSLLMLEKFCREHVNRGKTYLLLASGCVDGRLCVVIPPGNGEIQAQGLDSGNTCRNDGFKNRSEFEKPDLCKTSL